MQCPCESVTVKPAESGISRDTLWVRLHSAETGGDATVGIRCVFWHMAVFPLYIESYRKEDEVCGAMLFPTITPL